MHRLWSWSQFAFAAVLTGAALVATPPPVQAGCGCIKPAPAPAAVRPNVTYGGQLVTLFHSSLVNGGSYTVKFTAMDGTTASVTGAAVNRRDLADAVYKNQLEVTIPTRVPIGPVGITVTQAGQSSPFLSIPDTSFTLAPQPVAVPSQPGSYNYQNYNAAVGRDGKVYISLDLNGMTMPRTIQAQAKGYPLRFSKDNATFYNTQGFLMQLVGAPIPGLATITPGNTTDSDTLQYQRHEFATYFMQHGERTTHSTDPNDSNWHTDGTRHIDHNKLILAIAGGKVNGVTLAAGSTPAFTLALNSYSFFQHGLVGLNDVTLNWLAGTDSYNSRTGTFGSSGDVLSNKSVVIYSQAAVKGNVTYGTTLTNYGGQITGQTRRSATTIQFIPVAVPNGLTNLGQISVPTGTKKTLAPGSYLASGINVESYAELLINNTNGPVTVYVTGNVQITSTGKVTTTSTNPELFAVYVANNSPVQVSSGSSFYGVVYAPQSQVRLVSTGQFYGSFIGQSIAIDSVGKVHFDTALRGE